MLRRVKDRLRGRHNVSVAETDFHDDHQRSVLAVASVSGDPHRADEVLDQAEQQAARLLGADLIRAERERL